MMSTPLPPACDAKYRFDQVIATGGFGAVYRATHRELLRPVAIKVLHTELLQDPSQLRRFLQEARITAALKSPHIVDILEEGAEGQSPWIVFELIEGPSLRMLLEGGALPQPDALLAALHVTRALTAAHAAGVLHRDIKPENVLRADPDTYKLTDFGIARWKDSGTIATQRGIVLGTPGYLSPEQLTGGAASERTDLYALGALLFELLVGRLPFPAVTSVEAMTQKLKTPAPRLSSQVATVPAALDRLCNSLLSIGPRDRPPGAAEVEAALAQILEACGTAGRILTPPPSVDLSASKRRRPQSPPGEHATEVMEVRPEWSGSPKEHATELVAVPPPRSRRRSALFAGFVICVLLVIFRSHGSVDPVEAFRRARRIANWMNDRPGVEPVEFAELPALQRAMDTYMDRPAGKDGTSISLPARMAIANLTLDGLRLLCQRKAKAPASETAAAFATRAARAFPVVMVYARKCTSQLELFEPTVLSELAMCARVMHLIANEPDLNRLVDPYETTMLSELETLPRGPVRATLVLDWLGASNRLKSSRFDRVEEAVAACKSLHQTFAFQRALWAAWDGQFREWALLAVYSDLSENIGGLLFLLAHPALSRKPPAGIPVQLAAARHLRQLSQRILTMSPLDDNHFLVRNRVRSALLNLVSAHLSRQLTAQMGIPPEAAGNENMAELAHDQVEAAAAFAAALPELEPDGSHLTFLRDMLAFCPHLTAHGTSIEPDSDPYQIAKAMHDVIPRILSPAHRGRAKIIWRIWRIGVSHGYWSVNRFEEAAELTDQMLAKPSSNRVTDEAVELLRERFCALVLEAQARYFDRTFRLPNLEMGYRMFSGRDSEQSIAVARDAFCSNSNQLLQTMESCLQSLQTRSYSLPVQGLIMRCALLRLRISIQSRIMAALRGGAGRSEAQIMDIVRRTEQSLRSILDYVDGCDSHVDQHDDWPGRFLEVEHLAQQMDGTTQARFLGPRHRGVLDRLLADLERREGQSRTGAPLVARLAWKFAPHRSHVKPPGAVLKTICTTLRRLRTRPGNNGSAFDNWLNSLAPEWRVPPCP